MKRIYFIYLLVILAIGIAVLDVLLSAPKNLADPCPFCQSEILMTHQFYEDDLVRGLCTHKPIFPGHCLIIPKRHVERFERLTDEEIVRISQLMKRVDQAVQHLFGTTSYLILQKNGYEVGQTVSHVHFHYIPRRTGDNSTLSFLFRSVWINLQSPIKPTEVQANAEAMRHALEVTSFNFKI